MTLIQTKSFQIAIYSKGDPNSKKLALVLPGKLDTKDYAHMHSHVDHLATLGFFALSFDPPGTWESPGDISLYTTTNYLKALDEIIKHFGNKPTFVMGHSRGGRIAIIAGSKNPHIFAYASVMANCVKGWFLDKRTEQWERDGFLDSKRDLPPGGEAKLKEFRLPYSAYEDDVKHDLDEDIEKCTKPKLFILGRRDNVILPGDIKETVNLLSEPKELVEIDSDHDYRYHPEIIEEINKKIGEFLEKYKLL